MQQYLATKPFDLYGLHLFQLAAKHRSFVAAAREAGLSPSAFSRQMQSLEDRLGLNLINRTTRSVELTEAGRFLEIEAKRLIGGIATTLEGLHATFRPIQSEVRVGISRSLAMAHIPGLFHTRSLHQSGVKCTISCRPSEDIIGSLEANECDVGVICPPKKLPKTLEITHEFQDVFDLIAPTSFAIPQAKEGTKRFQQWLVDNPWLRIAESTQTGKQLRSWMELKGLKIRPIMELDNFDLIINLVAAGFGLAWVPRRAMAFYRRKDSITVLPTKSRFERRIVAITRKHRRQPMHVQDYIKSILF